MNLDRFYNYKNLELKDYGPNPFVFNIEEVTKKNNYFRVALWTGEHMQLTLMSIPVNDSIGLELHDVDQFIRLESGKALVEMGKDKNNLNYKEFAYDNYAIIIPINVKIKTDKNVKVKS